MKTLRIPLLILAAAVGTSAALTRAAAQETRRQPLAADTPSTTTAGHTFIAPAGWTLSVKGKATIVEAPEGDSRIVFVDVAAMDPDAAIQEAWAAYRAGAKWPLKAKTDASDKDGWTNQKTYSYQTSPNERRGGAAGAACRPGQPSAARPWWRRWAMWTMACCWRWMLRVRRICGRWAKSRGFN